jgi:hypothetical protein
VGRGRTLLNTDAPISTDTTELCSVGTKEITVSTSTKSCPQNLAFFSFHQNIIFQKLTLGRSFYKMQVMASMCPIVSRCDCISRRTDNRRNLTGQTTIFCIIPFKSVNLTGLQGSISINVHPPPSKDSQIPSDSSPGGLKFV